MPRTARGGLAAREPDARYLARAGATLVDSNVLIDVLADDPHWADWSIDQLDLCSRQGALVINPIILAELSPRFERATDLEAALSLLPLKREALPWDAAQQQHYEALDAQSLAAQKAIEDADTLPFEDWRQQYMDPRQLG